MSLSTESYGFILLFLSALLYSVAGLFVKLAAEEGLSSSTLVLLRAVFQGSIVLLGLCTFRDEDTQKRLIWYPMGQTRNLQKIVALRGLVGGTGFCLYFYTIAALPLGDATALVSLKPIPTIFLGRFILGEPIRHWHVVVTVTSILGSLLIAQPSSLFGTVTEVNAGHTAAASWGHVAGLLGACCAAGVVTLIRKAGTVGAHTLQLLFSWALFAVIFSAAILWQQSEPIRWPATRNSWLYVLALSIFGSIAHFLLNYAARLATASLSSIVRSSDLMFAYGWEIFFFHQIPNSWTWLGIACISTTLLVIAVQKFREHRCEEQSRRIDFQKLATEESNDDTTATSEDVDTLADFSSELVANVTSETAKVELTPISV